MTVVLRRLIELSDAALGRWNRWSEVILPMMPEWATEIRNCSISASVCVVVPDHVVDVFDATTVTHGDGTTERYVVRRGNILLAEDAGGWVHRESLLDDPQPWVAAVSGVEGKRLMSELRSLEWRKHAEVDRRCWWRPTDAGRRAIT